MPEVKYTSWFQRLAQSVGGIIIGILLFLGSFVVLFINEGTIDKSKIAATAVDVDAQKGPPANAVGLVDIAGTVTADKPIGDGLFLKPGPYLLVERRAEVYAWVEDKKTEEREDVVGGGKTTITTYSYRKAWVGEATSESKFDGYGKEDYLNFERSSGEKISNGRALNRTVTDGRNAVVVVKMGRYTIDGNAVELPSAVPVADLAAAADKAKVAATPGAGVNAGYVYIRRIRGTQADQIGDERVSYAVLKSGFAGTAFGRLHGASLEAFPIEEALKNSTALFRIFASDKQAAVQTLHSEFVLWLWVVRIIGFAMMWLGLTLVFAPISTLLGIVNILGKVSRFLVNAVLFVIALSLSVVTVLVSMAAHSVVALAVAIVVIIGLIVLIVLLVKRKKQAQQPATT
jgi:hypothetical protein